MIRCLRIIPFSFLSTVAPSFAISLVSLVEACRNNIADDYSIQENPSLDVFPKATGHSFKKDYKLECIDPKHPSYICVCTIVKVKGARLRLHFDGWSESYDFWTNVDSPFIFPMHWCEKNGQVLHPPRSESFKDR